MPWDTWHAGQPDGTRHTGMKVTDDVDSLLDRCPPRPPLPPAPVPPEGEDTAAEGETATAAPLPEGASEGAEELG